LLSASIATVVSSRIATSSGFAALDEEPLALVQRAEPFRAPPPEVSGSEIKVVVPGGFSLQ
jgi:protein TonB